MTEKSAPNWKGALRPSSYFAWVALLSHRLVSDRDARWHTLAKKGNSLYRHTLLSATI